MKSNSLKHLLESMADSRFRNFHQKLVPHCQYSILGIKLPKLRLLAKSLAANDWRQILAHKPESNYHEEIMIRGLIIGYVKDSDIDERLNYLTDIVPSLTNWSLCDSCCSTYQFVRKDRKKVFQWLKERYLSNDDEFLSRFGIVMLLMHFKKEKDYVSSILESLKAITTNHYYTQMAIAWCCCELFIHHPERADEILSETSFDETIRRMILQKIRDSKRCPNIPSK